jgi:hypothetical protein
MKTGFFLFSISAQFLIMQNTICFARTESAKGNLRGGFNNGSYSEG